jgi:hypothetical protein
MPDNDLVLITTRIPKDQWERVENWRRAQRKIPPLSHALRALLDRGLAAADNSEMEAA